MTLKRNLSISTILCLSVLPVFLHSQSSQSLRSSSGYSGAIPDRRALIQQMVNSVSRENIVNNIAGLQAFGNRYEYNPQQEAAADWIIQEIAAWGAAAESDPYTIGTSTFYGLDMLNKDTAWVVGVSGTLLSTRDGGRTWTRIAMPVGAVGWSLRAVDFIDSKIGLVVGPSDVIYRTTDGGLTWSSRFTGGPYIFMDIGFVNQRIGFAVGGGRQIYRTSDAGVTWSRVHTGTPINLRHLDILDSSNICVVGDGSILRSTDGGISWRDQVTGAPFTLYGVELIDARNGWAVGSGSTILQTTDGGGTWRPRADVSSMFPGKTFYDVCFSDMLNGWIAGSGGIILRTADGGQSWTIASTSGQYGTTPTMYRITHVAGKHLLSCGSYSTVTSSSDGGLTWGSPPSLMPSDVLHPSRNIIVTIPGQVNPEQEYLMIAHYDGASAGPGADDNASGTGAVMEAARVLKMYEFESTIRLIAVSAEELGLLGSGNYAGRAKQQGRTILGVVNADMIGYPLMGDTTRLVAGSYFVHCRLADSALLYNQRYGIGAKVVLSDSCSGSDHVSFAAVGYQAITVAEGSSVEIWSGRNPFYHKATDSLSKLHPGLMRRAAQLMVATVAELARPIGSAMIPTEYVLDQNYPNPFNSGTMITFRLPEISAVKLRVYDILGKHVATLYDGLADAGLHRIAWRAEGLSSGVYFYRLQTGSYSETRKLILIR